MNTSLRALVLVASCGAMTIMLANCDLPPEKATGSSETVTLTPAPPGPSDLGPATGLSEPPEGAAVFELGYLAQTGSTNDISYFSFWGYGGNSEEGRQSAFIKEVLKRAPKAEPQNNPQFKKREWSALEYDGRNARALYFDLNADGKLQDDERIPPTRKRDQAADFITRDFVNEQEDRTETLCRALLQVNFYGGTTPNCMWSPACVLESKGSIDGEPARLLLFESAPGKSFDQYGESRFALLLGDGWRFKTSDFIPREALSSVVVIKDQFYQLRLQGRRTNGLPARVVLTTDASPRGKLTARLAGSEQLQASIASLYLHGESDKTTYLRVSNVKDAVTLPVGTYSLYSGDVSYGKDKPREWELSFQKGPRAAIKAGELAEVSLGQPVLRVRAVPEEERYSSLAKESATYKKGTRIYLEPKIAGAGKEVFSRFRHPKANGKMGDVAPKIVITSAAGKQVLSKTMEYG